MIISRAKYEEMADAAASANRDLEHSLYLNEENASLTSEVASLREEILVLLGKSCDCPCASKIDLGKAADECFLREQDLKREIRELKGRLQS